MFSILGIIFFFIIAILLFGLSIINGVIRAIFGMGRRPPSSGHTATSGRQSDTTRESRKENKTKGDTQRKKIFDKEDGEYVDFEEIKDEKPRPD